MNSSFRAKRDSDRLLRQTIGKILALKLCAGTSLTALRRFANSCVADAERDYVRLNVQTSLDLHGLGSILRTWHTETCFLSDDGKPRALSVEGKNGLRTLILKHYTRSKYRDVLSALSRGRLIRKREDGLWAPTERHARIPRATPELLLHFAEGIARLTDTVDQNTRSRSKENLLFERASKVPRLPAKEAKAFRKFAATQGAAFLNAIDDWLESRSLRTVPRGRRTCPAGVYVFAFLGKQAAFARRKKLSRD